MKKHCMRNFARILFTVALMNTLFGVSAQPLEYLKGATPKQVRIRELCSSSAGQKVFGTANDVKSIGIVALGERTYDGMNFSSESSGVSYTNRKYNYGGLGVEEIEFDAALLHPNEPERFGTIVVVNPKSGKEMYSGARKSPVVIEYKRASSSSDEELGIYGRTMTIRWTATGKTLAEKTEFFWFSGTDVRNRIWHEGSICPGFTLRNQSLPKAFFGEVINPKSAPCHRIFMEGMTQSYSLRKKEYLESSAPGWSERNRAREDKLLKDSYECSAKALRDSEGRIATVEWIR